MSDRRSDRHETCAGKRSSVAGFVAAVVVGLQPQRRRPTPRRDAVGGNGDVPRSVTDWPGPSPTPPPTHQPYPIVLAHGFSGFHNIGPLTYFYGVQDALSKDGHEVYVTTVDPYNSSEVRGAELLDAGRRTSSPTAARRKVNLICHSQGALDCRYVANQLGKQDRRRRARRRRQPRRLRGRHRRRARCRDRPATRSTCCSRCSATACSIPAATRTPTPRRRSRSSPPPAATRSTPSIPTIRTSPTSRSPGAPRTAAATLDCGSGREAPFIGKWDQVKGPVNPLLCRARRRLIDGSASPPPTNDGLVTVASARWGTFLGCVPADHLAEVCQIGGQSSGSSFDCVTMYPRSRRLARRRAASDPKCPFMIRRFANTKCSRLARADLEYAG